jgi:type II secretory pathway component PulC
LNARTRQKIIVAALPLAMIWGAYNMFWVEQKSPPVQPEITAQADTTTTKPLFAPAGPDMERIKTAEWGADPFRSAVKKPAKRADKRKEELKLILSGIVFNEKSPMAVINKKTVRTGDTIDGAHILSIDRKSVTVERSGKQFQLKVTKS